MKPRSFFQPPPKAPPKSTNAPTPFSKIDQRPYPFAEASKIGIFAPLCLAPLPPLARSKKIVKNFEIFFLLWGVHFWGLCLVGRTVASLFCLAVLGLLRFGAFVCPLLPCFCLLGVCIRLPAFCLCRWLVGAKKQKKVASPFAFACPCPFGLGSVGLGLLATLLVLGCLLLFVAPLSFGALFWALLPFLCLAGLCV